MSMSMCMSSGTTTRMCVFQVAYAEEIPSTKAQQGVQEINFADRESGQQQERVMNPSLDTLYSKQVTRHHQQVQCDD